MTDNVQIQIATLILGTVTLTVNTVVGYLIAKLRADQRTRADDDSRKARVRAKKAAVVAVRVDEVRKALAESMTVAGVKLDGLVVSAASTLSLVNGGMAAQKLATANALRRVATLTSDPDDVAAALVAEKVHRDHLAAQAIVDAANRPADA